jgi:hypothetical protein
MQNVYMIHPNGDMTKSVGVLGRAFVVGTAADMYIYIVSGCHSQSVLTREVNSFDCNGSITQEWYFTLDDQPRRRLQVGT